MFTGGLHFTTWNSRILVGDLRVHRIKGFLQVSSLVCKCRHELLSRELIPFLVPHYNRTQNVIDFVAHPVPTTNVNVSAALQQSPDVLGVLGNQVLHVNLVHLLATARKLQG